MMIHKVLALAVLVAAIGCRPAPVAPQFPDAYDPAYAAQQNGVVDATISQSVGPEGGVVVLWPRVVPSSQAEARAGAVGAVQELLRQLAEQTLPDHPIEVRPAPQRSCPRSGCAAIALGAVVATSGAGCAVAATVARPGQQPTWLAPWTDNAQLRATTVPFREPPESLIHVRDYHPCDELEEHLQQGQTDVVELLRRAAASPEEVLSPNEPENESEESEVLSPNEPENESEESGQ
jgi:hypothetical protein